MKLWKKIVLGIIAVIIIAVAGIVIWQWENTSALYIYSSKTEAEITEMAETNHKNTEEIIGKYDGITVKDISPDIEKALIQGEITVEEAIETITGSNPQNTQVEIPAGSENTMNQSSMQGNQQSAQQGSEPSTKQESTAQPGTSSEQTTSQQSNQNTTQEQPVVNKEVQIINNYLEKIYIVKANFLGRIGQLAQEAKDEFYKFPLKERTKANKTATILNKLNECYALESECDAEVENLLNQLTAELSQIGADTSVADDIRAAYKNDKSVKKAYYMQSAFK